MCVRCQELTVGILAKEGYKYKTMERQTEESLRLGAKTFADRCCRLRHIQHTQSLLHASPESRSSPVLPCKEEPTPNPQGADSS